MFIDNSTIYYRIFVNKITRICRILNHLLPEACFAAGYSMEDITMKRKPKMHNEQEFNLDNIYQEDDRQLDNLDDTSFDMRYK